MVYSDEGKSGNRFSMMANLVAFPITDVGIAPFAFGLIKGMFVEYKIRYPAFEAPLIGNAAFDHLRLMKFFPTIAARLAGCDFGALDKV